MKIEYCKKCVMDGSAEEITFDEKGVCNFCHNAQRELKLQEELKQEYPEVIEKLRNPKGKYDVLMGLSGGVDSSTALHRIVKVGLRPLCFSLDNGYNVSLADENVKKLVKKLGVDWIKYKIDLDKYSDLQSAFFKAGQKNIEIPTDHILMAVTYKIANKHGIKWVISGGNVETESIMPASWGYQPRDLVHIKDVYKKIKGKKLKGLPTCGLLKWNWYKWIKRIKIFYILDYTGYNRAESVKMLEKEYGFKDYHEKHCESYFTWWFQNCYLFEKFGIDKRKAHLSAMINSGQMTREKAREILAEVPIYPNIGMPLGILNYFYRPYTDFKTDEKLFRFISKVIKFFK